MSDIDLNDFKADWDWRHAFYEAVSGYCGDVVDSLGPIESVTKVHYASEGENDGDSWIAVVEWSGEEGGFAVVDAGCDCTGWDCQASGFIDYYPSLSLAISSLTPEQARRFGLPHDADNTQKTDVS